jgi:signal transduction histidine kinase
MSTFAAMILTPQNISYNIIADEKLKKLQFSGEQLKNIFLIYKEALHNIVKYAACNKVKITLCLQINNLLMLIEDDGKGFDADAIISNHRSVNAPFLGGMGGAGITNMFARANDLHAELCINSTINAGTIVQLTTTI